MALGINERKDGDSQRKMTYLSDQKKTESPEDSRLWKHFETIVSNMPKSSFRICKIFASFIQKGYKALLTFRPKANCYYISIQYNNFLSCIKDRMHAILHKQGESN